MPTPVDLGCGSRHADSRRRRAEDFGGGRDKRGTWGWPAAKATRWGWRARRHGADLAGAVCDGAAEAAANRCHVPAKRKKKKREE